MCRGSGQCVVAVATFAASITMYVTQQAQVIGTKGATVDLIAHCPGGYTPVGGGYDMPDAVSSGFVTDVTTINGAFLGATGATYFILGIVVHLQAQR